MAREWKVGDRLENRWEIHKVFRGGMGVVYVVHDYDWNQALAAKSFQDSVFARSPSIAPMFRQEALAWVQLGLHPNIAQASFVQEIEGKPVLFLEYVSGGDLSQWIGTPRLMEDPKRLLQFAIAFCDGMIHARSKGIEVHRDIKPQNCLITEGGTLKITDFGLAKVVGGLQSGDADGAEIAHPEGFSLSRTGQAAGTVTHMPPEQFVDSKHVGVTADIYSFGVMLFQMITGRLPFRGRTWAEFERMHTEDPPPIWEVGHPQMQGLLSRCLEKSPASRYQNFEHVRPLLTAIYEAILGERAPVPIAGALMDASQWLNRGVSLAALGLRDPAKACYDRALSVDPTFAQAWSNKANLIRDAGSLEEAIQLYDRAIAADPGLDLAWYNKGATLEMLGRSGDALLALERALTINPRLVMAWSSRGVALEKLGRAKEAATSFGEALRIDPESAAAIANLGNQLRRQGEHEKALSCFDRALVREPKRAELWNNRGNALMDLGRYGEALQSFSEALACEETFFSSWLGKGNAHKALGEWKDALSCYGRAMALQPDDTHALYNSGLVHERLGQPVEALAAFDKTLEVDSQDAEAWLRKGAAHCALGQEEEAFAAYTTAVTVNPKHAVAWHNRAIQAKALGRKEEALESHSQALALDPSIQEGWLGKGNALADLGRDEEALAAYDEAIRLDADFASAWFSKGATLGNADRYKEALVCFERAASLGHPKGAGAAEICRRSMISASSKAPEQRQEHDQGVQFVGEGRFAEAVECFDRALAFEPQQPVSWFGKGVALGKLDRHTESLYCYERATEMDAAYALAWLNRGITLYFFHYRFEEALQCLERAASLGSENAPKAIENCRRRMSEMAATTVDPLTACERALESTPADAQLLVRKAEILCDLQRLDEAQAACDKAMDGAPGLAAAWFAKGRVNYEKGWHGAALVWFNGGLKFATNDPLGWYRKALALEKLGQLDEAVAAYQESIAADPGKVECWHRCIGLLDELGRYPESLESHRSATAANPGDAGLWSARAKAHQRAGDTQDAIEAYERAAQLGDRDAFAEAEKCRRPAGPPPEKGAEEWLDEGMALSAEGKTAEAVLCFERALEINPAMVTAQRLRENAWYDRGASLFRAGKAEEALSCFDKALEESPRSLDSLQAKGMTLSQLGRHEEALHVAGRALAIDPEFAPALCLQGLELVMLDRQLEEALALLERSEKLGYALAANGLALCRQALAKQMPKEDAASLHNQGCELDQQNRPEEALVCFEKSLALGPQTVETWFGKAIVLYKLNRHEEELLAYDEVIHRLPDMAAAWFNKGRTLGGKLRRYSEALDCFQRARQLGHPHAAQGIAVCENEVGKAQPQTPQTDASTWFRQGSELSRQGGRTAEALQCFESALTLDAGMVDAWWGRAIMLGQLGRAVEAIESLDQALHRNPTHAGVWASKGATLANTGRFQEALPCYERAAQLGDGNAKEGAAYCRRALGWPPG